MTIDKNTPPNELRDELQKLADSKQLNPIIIPMIRKLYPTLVASQIVGVQPMTSVKMAIFNHSWGPWQKKFAWLPTKVNGATVWLKEYYYRDNRFTVVKGKPQREFGTLLDVLRSPDHHE